mgnify:CR=1 FL=1
MDELKTSQIMSIIEEGRIDDIYQNPNAFLAEIDRQNMKVDPNEIKSRQRFFNFIRWESIKASSMVVLGTLMLGRNSTQRNLFRLRVINKIKKHLKKL